MPGQLINLRKFTGPKLVIASHNAGKLREIAALIAPFGWQAIRAGDLGVEEPEETQDTFIGNAKLKALKAARKTGLPALSDDSGLAVLALNGRPGVHSARYAERAAGKRDFAWAMKRLERELKPHEDRRAQFICALALAWPDGHVETFEGTVHGTLCWPPQGDRGFGYDPIFVPKDHDITFGQMDPEKKHRMSHRAQAFDQLMRGCFA